LYVISGPESHCSEFFIMRRKEPGIISAINKTSSAISWVGVVSVSALMLLIAWDVFMRYVLDNPTGWTLEITISIQLLFGYLCAGYVLKRGGLISMTLLTDHVSEKTRTKMALASSVIGILICTLMVYCAVLMVKASYRMGELTSLIGFPMYILKSFVLIGFFFLGVQYVAEIYKNYRLLKANQQ
jgi:TRAP-type C4-dicarboxylate transport system permease small subunit